MGRKANIIAITSGKGGVGKSSIAVNLGILFAKRGKRVCLVDGDYGLANINLLLGLPAKKQPSDLFEKSFNPQKAMIKTEWGLDILPSASGISQQQPILAPSSVQVRRLIEKIVYDYDVILIDTAAGIGASVQNYLEVANQAILIINSEPTSLTDGFGLIKNMRSVQANYNVLVNRVKDDKSAKDIFKRFAGAVNRYIGVKVERLGYIQEDSFASAAILSQSPLVIYSSNCNASLCFSKIVKTLLAQLQRKVPSQKENIHVSEDITISEHNETPEKAEFIKLVEDSFEKWLQQMPNLLSDENVPSKKHRSLSFKERRKKFILELGQLCLNDKSILKNFESMVIGKSLEQDVINEDRYKYLGDAKNDIDISEENLKVNQKTRSDKIVRLSDYADNKISM